MTQPSMLAITPEFEFYETPHAFTRYLFRSVFIRGRVFEPCAGSGAIVTAAEGQWPRETAANRREWITNDIDRRWQTTYFSDATNEVIWDAVGDIDWTVTNPPFEPAIDILRHAIARSRVGVAMHLRASIHEVLKTGPRRTFMADHPPTGLLWLPRFAYQRSKTTAKWSTDSVCACWVIWLRQQHGQFIRYAPPWVLDALDEETPAYRRRMDALMHRRTEVPA